MTVMPFLRSRPVASIAVTAAAAVIAPVLLVPGAAYADEPVGGGKLGSHGIVVGAGAGPLPDVAAQSWVVADATTGQVLAAKDPHLRHRPASTLKTLTSIALMPRLDPSAVHEVTASEQTPVYGSRAGLVVGGTYTVDDLWHGLLLPSGNDAAAALAAEFGGVKKTVKAMNSVAATLQARDTKAVNPSGLDANGQYTSAYDMALIARAALGIPEFVRVSGTTSYDLPGAPVKPGKTRSTYKIYGENRLLNHGFPGIIAGKTGYTSLAGRTFWVAGEHDGHTILVTLMGVSEATEDAAGKLMRWGYKNQGRTGSVGTLVAPVTASPDQPSAAPTGPGAVGPVSAAEEGAPPDPASQSRTGVLLVAVVLVVAAALIGFEFFWRRRRRGSPETTAEPPAAGTADPDPAPGGSGGAAPPADGGAATGSVTVRPAPGVVPVSPPVPSARPERASEPAVPDEDTAPHAPVRPTQPPAPEPERDDGPAEHARPAPITPTGNVRVMRPATPPDEPPAR